MWWLSYLSAVAQPWVLHDAGMPDRPGTPAAVIVMTPGFADGAYQPMVNALEDAGFNALTLRFPLAAQQSDDIVKAVLPTSLSTVSADRIVVVGHGLGGTLSAQTLVSGADARVAGLALLAAPVRLPHQALTTWLAHQAIPDGLVEHDALQAALWNEASIIDILLGPTPIPLTTVSPDWLTSIQAWTGGHDLFDPSDLTMPVWMGFSNLDSLCPPESVRPIPEGVESVRFGHLHLQGRTFTHGELLMSSSVNRTLASWAWEQVQ